MKQLLFGLSAREKLVKGVNVVAEAVGSTLGPKGSNVALGTDFGYPRVVHDGVSVAKEIDLVDPYEDMGAQLVKGAAQRTNDEAGDGTTTATILAQSMVNQGMKAIKGSWSNKGANPMILNKGINMAVKQVVGNLKGMAKPVTQDEWEKVATISSQSEVIGKIVAEATKKVGPDGVIDVQEGSDIETKLEVKEGMEFARGYKSPYFMTNVDTLEAIQTDVSILLCDFRIFNSADLIPFLTEFVKESKNLVIIAEDIEHDALRFLVTNHMKHNINCICIKSPGFGERRKDWLRDIAFLTGATVISEETGKSLTKVTIKDLGFAKRVVATKDKTRIVEGAGKKKEIEKRIKQVKLELKKATNDFEKNNVKERLAKLSGGVAVITAGAPSEVEMREVKERIIDAVNATQSAIEEGIVVGGEMALYYATAGLSALPTSSDDEARGVEIVQEACKTPFARLILNSGYDLEEIRDYIENGQFIEDRTGFDVMDGQWKDLLESGVIDPVKVTRNAIENAASVATMILTTNTLVVLVKEDK